MQMVASVLWIWSPSVLEACIYMRPGLCKGGGKRFGVGQNYRGVWGRKFPRSWRIFKVVTSKIYAFLVVFHTFSPIYAYFFPVLAVIIPLSLRNGGHLIPFAPLSASGGGATAPSAPGSAMIKKKTTYIKDKNDKAINYYIISHTTFQFNVCLCVNMWSWFSIH